MQNVATLILLVCNKKGPGSEFVTGEYSCSVVHGDRSQQERQANLQQFKTGEVRFLITTDVGARGIDISEIPYVISMSSSALC